MTLNKTDFNFVVFDFDGVLVDSTGLKTEVFKKTLEGYSPEAIESFLTFHKLHGGVSRWEKLEHFLKNIVNTPDEEVLSKKKILAEKFSAILTAAFDSIKLTPGAIETLNTLQSLGIKCFIVSGAAENEVITLAQNNKIDQYFETILGSPKNKFENLTMLKDKGQFEGNGFFIGDAFTDFTSANQFQLPFVFMSAFTEWKDWKHEQDKFFLHVNDLNELNNKLKNETKGK